MGVPKYLGGHARLHSADPRAAALAWFREARFGLFMHYGLYSMLGGVWGGREIARKGAEWIRWAAPIPFADYAALRDRFTADRFDADFICRLAAGVWLDGIGGFKGMADGVERSRCRELYDLIHASQPGILVSYKQGLTLAEDFFAPERSVRREGDGAVAAGAPTKPFEICTTLQPTSWGYRASDGGVGARP